jgi:uncharacterized membrane protein YphA (DoxX/SURF4 family)
MTTPASSSRFARFAVHAARILLGLIFFVFGLGALLNWFPPPPPESLPPKLVAFDAGLRSSGYLFELLKGTETAMGVLLLLNRFVPLALVILAPIILNIVLVHVLLAPSGLPVAIVVLALELYLAWAHRRAYAPLLTAKFA